MKVTFGIAAAYLAAAGGIQGVQLVRRGFETE